MHHGLVSSHVEMLTSLQKIGVEEYSQYFWKTNSSNLSVFSDEHTVIHAAMQGL